ncbi:MAG: hypothetical protein DRQ61_09835 [Gammaproteobacteria bacterium]|nr:MAG: hypothetical protein DRQ61_09835 [Gammaproteobacteria bacterium]
MFEALRFQVAMEEKTEKDRIIDLSKKRTELEWSHEIQEVSEKAATAWFRWVGWMFAIGGISYLADKTNSTILKAFEVISLVLLTIYFLMFFVSIRIEPYHSWARSCKTRWGRIIAFAPLVIVTGLLFAGSKEVIDTVVQLVKEAK